MKVLTALTYQVSEPRGKWDFVVSNVTTSAEPSNPSEEGATDAVEASCDAIVDGKPKVLTLMAWREKITEEDP